MGKKKNKKKKMFFDKKKENTNKECSGFFKSTLEIMFSSHHSCEGQEGI
jgi:hypothetical protein